MAEAGDGVCERKHGGRARASGSAAETVVVTRTASQGCGRRPHLTSAAQEARLVVEEATTVRGGAAGACGAVFDVRRLAGGVRRCSGPTCRQRLSGGEHRCVSRGLAGGERRVKTQLGLSRTDNDEWLPGESPVLGSFEPPTDGGGSFPSLLSLETSAL
uniref:Uncharacterized protein n=1 Tax=Oryza rufipogon TaxID=4529 RepID=A0A0E0Q845_ORYRU